MLYTLCPISIITTELLAGRGFYDRTLVKRLSVVAPVALPIIRREKRMAEKLNTASITGRST